MRFGRTQSSVLCRSVKWSHHTQEASIRRRYVHDFPWRTRLLVVPVLGAVVLAGVLTSCGSEGKTAQGLVAAHGLAVRNGLIAFDNQTSNQTFVMKPNGHGSRLFIQYGVMPTWSPSGKELAYVGSYLDPKTDNYEPRLYV